MRVVSLDISSQSGWGAWDGVSPVPTLGKKRVLFFDRREGQMLESWRDWLGRFIAEHQPEAAAIEGAAHGTHGDAVTENKLAMLRGFALWAFHVSGIPAYQYPPSTWRKTFIGRGRRKDGDPSWKTLATRQCRLLKWDAPDHNAADAAGVLDHLVTSELKIMPPWRSTAEGFARFNLPPELFHNG